MLKNKSSQVERHFRKVSYPEFKVWPGRKRLPRLPGFYADFDSMWPLIIEQSKTRPISRLNACGSILVNFARDLRERIGEFEFTKNARISVVIPNPENVALVEMLSRMEHGKRGTDEEVSKYRHNLGLTLALLDDVREELRAQGSSVSLTCRTVDQFIWYRLVCVDPDKSWGTIFVKEYTYRDPSSKGTYFGGIYPKYENGGSKGEVIRYRHYRSLFERFYAAGIKSQPGSR